MENLLSSFELEINGVKMKVLPLNLPGFVSFRIEFSSKRKPIVVARVDDFNGAKFWTSIPEGRQKEAEGVGKLIEDYFKSQQS
jgi:hypothetical protein